MRHSSPTGDGRLDVALVLWTGRGGGAENFTLTLAREIQARGHAPTVVFITDAAPLSEALESSGIPFVSLDFESPRMFIRAARRFARVLADVGPDGTLLARPGYWASVARIGGYRGRLIAIEHGGLLQTQSLPRHRRVARRVERWLGARALDVEVGVSAYMTQELMRWPHATRVERIDNGIDLTAYTERRSTGAPSGVVVAAAGRHVQGKGMDTFIRAIAELPREFRDGVRFVIAGQGPETEALRTLAAELGVASTLSFAGWVRDMSEFWSGVDLAVVPSSHWIESFGLTAVEALACGVPVIVTDNGALPEVVAGDDVVGEVVPAGDASITAQRIQALIEDPARLSAMRAAARRHASRYSIERCADRYVELLASV